MANDQFKLKWEEISTGRVFVSDYWWCPTSVTAKYQTCKTLAGYKRSCIAFGKREGYRYLGQVKG